MKKNVERQIQNLGATKSTEYSLWKVTKNLKKQPKTNHPIRKANNSWTKSNVEKATTFEHDVFTPNTNENTLPHIKTF